jgi:hypothetical protein
MIALALGTAGATVADDTPPVSDPPQRVRSVSLSPGQTCPKAAKDEVVVCATLDEPYRIPKALRKSEITAANQSWVNRAALMDDAGRVAAGLPDTCSVVGTGGQSGCMQSTMRAWSAERRQMAKDAAAIP